MQYIKGPYLFYDNDFLWYNGEGKRHRPVLAIRRVLVLKLVSLVHASHGHPGIVATPTLLQERCF